MCIRDSLIGGGAFSAQQAFRFAFNEPAVAQAPIAANPAVPQPNMAHSAKTIGGSWQPSDDALRQLAQLGVTREFAQQQIPPFVAYWRERNVPRHSWESK